MKGRVMTSEGWVQVDAKPATTPGLIVTRRLDRDQAVTNGWLVTHEDSGVNATGYWFPSAAKALAAANELGTLDVVWEGGEATIKKTKAQFQELARQVRAIASKHGGRT